MASTIPTGRYWVGWPLAAATEEVAAAVDDSVDDIIDGKSRRRNQETACARTSPLGSSKTHHLTGTMCLSGYGRYDVLHPHMRLYRI